MENANVSISADGIMTITIDLKVGIGESSSGKSILIGRSSGRMEDFSAGGNDYYIALTVGQYKEKKKRVEEAKPAKKTVALTWSKSGADMAKPAVATSNGTVKLNRIKG